MAKVKKYKSRPGKMYIGYSLDIEKPIYEALDYVAARDGVTKRDIVIMALVDVLMKLCDDSSVWAYIRYLKDEAKRRKRIGLVAQDTVYGVAGGSSGVGRSGEAVSDM